ncbi:MAG TPA: PDZ domain-containing protein, partial [Sphingomicrobium sp.]|nr:PDZ domain-containing protein [Sphingomicrobium sp.]
INFSSFDPRGAGTPLQFKFYDHMPELRGLIDNLPARFNIDTGSRSELDITGPFVVREGLRKRYTSGISAITGWGAGGASRSYVVRIPKLSLGPVKVRSIVAGLNEDKGGSLSDPNYEGNLGSGLLKRFVVTFDYRRETMYLKSLNPPPLDAGAFDRSGMWINAADVGYRVVNVSAGGPAEQAGLVMGDLITAIDRKPALPDGLADARLLLRSLPAGTAVTISLTRDGQQRTTRMILRDLI